MANLCFFSTMTAPESSGSRSWGSKPQSGVCEGPQEPPCKGRASVSCFLKHPQGTSGTPRNELEKVAEAECWESSSVVSSNFCHLLLNLGFHLTSLLGLRFSLAFCVIRTCSPLTCLFQAWGWVLVPHSTSSGPLACFSVSILQPNEMPPPLSILRLQPFGPSIIFDI